MIEQGTDLAPPTIGGARLGFAQQGLELGEDLFDRVEIGRIAGQEEQLGAGGADQTADGLALMAAEIVHDHAVAAAQSRHQELFHIGAKAGAVDRAVDDAGRGNAIAAQRRQKGQRAPASLRHLGNEAGAASAPSMPPGHVGLGPGLVDEDQVFGVEPALIFLPPLAPAGDIGAVLFAGVQALFLNVMPSYTKNAQSAPWLTLSPSAASSAWIARNLRSGFSAIRASSQSRLLARRCGRHPPIAKAAALPVV